MFHYSSSPSCLLYPVLFLPSCVRCRKQTLLNPNTCTAHSTDVSFDSKPQPNSVSELADTKEQFHLWFFTLLIFTTCKLFYLSLFGSPIASSFRKFFAYSQKQCCNEIQWILINLDTVVLVCLPRLRLRLRLRFSMVF